MLRSIKTFRNVRARVCRTTDGTWHAGWVVHLTQEEARLRLNAFLGFQTGETMIGEFYGDGTLVRCAGKVRGQSGQDLGLTLTTSLVFEPSPNTVRFLIEDSAGTLRGEGSPTRFFVMDVSPKSMGGLCERSFAPGTVLHLCLQTPGGSFEAKVGVINCRAVDAQASHFRIGLRILEASRLDAAFWDRLLAERASV